jgi:hypothetical protein
VQPGLPANPLSRGGETGTAPRRALRLLLVPALLVLLGGCVARAPAPAPLAAVPPPAAVRPPAEESARPASMSAGR